MKGLQQYVKTAKRMGADGAKIISARNVFVRDWVFIKCRFGCDGYDQCWTCPPHSPSPEQTRRIVAEYKRALLCHFKVKPRGKRKRTRRINISRFVNTLERMIFLDGHHKAWGMGCGPCGLCREDCGEKECRHPREARPAMEACGVDVFATVRKAGFPIKVVSDYNERSDRFCLIMIE